MNNIKEAVNTNENKILLAISDTAPSECATGDLYYNTTSKKIFEATGTNTWGTTGTNPTSNTIYILFDTKTTYSYDGTDLVSVGGGGAEVSVSTTQPTEDELIWINPNESTNQAKFKDGNTWKELTIKALDSMPIGSIIGFVGTDIPNGWLICDGSTLDEETYPELYDALGGSGSTFTLPDCKGRVLVGYDANDTNFNAIGKTGGSKTDNLSNAYAKVGRSSSDYNALQYTQKSGSGTFNRKFTAQSNTISGSDNNITDVTALGGSVSTLQPYIVQYWIIKAKNTTPTMASIVNTTNNSTTDGYSCKFINDSEKYSTTEVKTNKTWINGKPIYRKVIESSGTMTTNNWNTITTINNVDTLINGYILDTNNKTIWNEIMVRIVNNDLQYFSMNFNHTYTKIIVEYTKTTD
jgi:microcystin-dependent protein